MPPGTIDKCLGLSPPNWGRGESFSRALRRCGLRPRACCWLPLSRRLCGVGLVGECSANGNVPLQVGDGHSVASRGKNVASHFPHTASHLTARPLACITLRRKLARRRRRLALASLAWWRSSHVTSHVVVGVEQRVLKHYGSIMVQAGSYAPLAASPGRSRRARIARSLSGGVRAVGGQQQSAAAVCGSG